MNDTSGIAIYHEMCADEGFLATAGMLWAMVHSAAQRYPGYPRTLYLDIEGHGREEYDDEAGEVVSFTRAALGPFLTEAPWGKACKSARQSEALPDVIITAGDDRRPRVLTGNHDRPVSGPGLPPHAGRDSALIAALYVRTHGAFTRNEETRS